MRVITELRNWMYELREKNYEEPKTIPISRIEVDELIQEMGPMVEIPVRPDMPNTVFGIEADITHFASAIRCKRLQMPVSQYMHECSVDDMLRHNSEVVLHRVGYEQIQMLKLHILTETTKLTVTFEWDIFARLKRLFKLDNRYPIKTKTAIIDCKVLYPKCKVSLPHNKHVFKASLK